MSTFTVNPTSLMDLAAALVKIHEEMTGMKTTASGYDGEIGGSDLEGELSDFCSGWTYGVGQINDHMGGVIQRLMQAAVAYEKNEQQTVDATNRVCTPNHPGEN